MIKQDIAIFTPMANEEKNAKKFILEVLAYRKFFKEFKFVSSKNVECFFQHFFLGVLSRFHSVACRNCKTPADSGVLSKFGCVLVHKTSLLLGL